MSDRVSDLVPDLVRDLVRIGAIQFGQFEAKDRPGEFAPITIRLGLLPSYPAILRALAQDLVPLVKINGVTHLLAAPNAVPLGVAVSLVADMPLVYPAPGDPDSIEGAYDYSVPTVLLTDVRTDGSLERALIKRVKSVGLEVQAISAVLSLRTIPSTFDVGAGHVRPLEGEVPLSIWHTLPDLLPKITTPVIASAVRDWLAAQNPGE